MSLEVSPQNSATQFARHLLNLYGRGEVERVLGLASPDWPDQFVNSRTGRAYSPHNDDEAVFVYDDVPRYGLLKGGWGAGKSAAGVVKSLGRLRRGMNGIAVSPEFEHFRVSLWPALRDWVPWDMVVSGQRDRQSPEWTPYRSFSLVFTNGATLYCGGIKDATSWFGGNVHFCHFDEAARYPDAGAFKTLVSRARLTGPDGEPPQVFITTTPAKNWLFEYFGPLRDNDPLAEFKTESSSLVITIRTRDNLDNLDPDYETSQRETLTAAESRQYLDAEWEDISDVEKFVNVVWWDNCRQELPPLNRNEPMVLAADAATGGTTEVPDTFAVVGVTRHPGNSEHVAVRYCGVWLPPAGGLLDFDPIEEEIRRLCKEFAVVELAYDKTQLHEMMMRFRKQCVVNAKEFSQQTDRLVADKQLRDLIMARRIAHDGNPLLRQHVDNANIKKSGQEGIRLVKRSESLKIDSCVALSMGCARALYLNLA